VLLIFLGWDIIAGLRMKGTSNDDAYRSGNFADAGGILTGKSSTVQNVTLSIIDQDVQITSTSGKAFFPKTPRRFEFQLSANTKIVLDENHKHVGKDIMDKYIQQARSCTSVSDLHAKLMSKGRGQIRFEVFIDNNSYLKMPNGNSVTSNVLPNGLCFPLMVYTLCLKEEMFGKKEMYPVQVSYRPKSMFLTRSVKDCMQSLKDPKFFVSVDFNNIESTQRFIQFFEEKIIEEMRESHQSYVDKDEHANAQLLNDEIEKAQKMLSWLKEEKYQYSSYGGVGDWLGAKYLEHCSKEIPMAIVSATNDSNVDRLSFYCNHRAGITISEDRYSLYDIVTLIADDSQMGRYEENHYCALQTANCTLQRKDAEFYKSFSTAFHRWVNDDPLDVIDALTQLSSLESTATPTTSWGLSSMLIEDTSLKGSDIVPEVTVDTEKLHDSGILDDIGNDDVCEDEPAYVEPTLLGDDTDEGDTGILVGTFGCMII